jgi:hypothetical protein
MLVEGLDSLVWLSMVQQHTEVHQGIETKGPP